MFDVKKTKDACVQWIRDWFEENGPGCNAVIGMWPASAWRRSAWTG